MDMRVVTICRKGEEVIAKYPARIPASLAHPPVLNDQARQALIDAAKDGLMLEHKAEPPFEGITFEVVRQ
jgi:hypothetical protein